MIGGSKKNLSGDGRLVVGVSVDRWSVGRWLLVIELTEDLSVSWWWLVVGRLSLAVGGQFIQNLFHKS